MDMIQDKSLKVTMHNDLIRSKSMLSLNEIKLLRLAVMQVMKDDTDFQTYSIPITDLSFMLQVPRPDMYRDIQKICTNLVTTPVYIGDGNPKHKWKVFTWVSMCQYEDGIITIKLHDCLKPYLLELKGLYTQYVLQDVLSMKSVYAIRVYELLREKMRGNIPYADKKVNVILEIDAIRKATATENKYSNYGSFKEKVIEKAKKEINEKTTLHVEYEQIKHGKKVVKFNFTVYSLVGWMQQEKRPE